MSKFIIHGNKKLNGKIVLNSAKNSTIALIVASLINRGVTRLKNVPQIEEVNSLLSVLESLGVNIEKKYRELIIKPPKKLKLNKLDKASAQKTRIIILGLSVFASYQKKFNLPQAKGCRLGSRTVMPHLYALEKFGYHILTSQDAYEVNCRKLKKNEVILYESGDTVTENAILAAAQIPGKSTIKFASGNYMVQELCFFLQKLGIKISGIGQSSLIVEGKSKINKDIEYSISEDPIEGMLFLSSAIITNSSITIKRCPIDFLALELLKLEKMGFNYKILKRYKAENKKTDLVDIKTMPSKLKALHEKIHALPYPGINQDNLPFFAPIATRAKGETLIHDWTYEYRAIYFSELNKLGASINFIDNHRVIIKGPSKLKGTEIMAPPALRPAAIILVAMLGAIGKSTLTNIYHILRGYENLEKRLNQLGADIKLIKN